MASPYRISTITFNGDLNVYLRGPIFFQHSHIVQDPVMPGFVWMECWFNGQQQTLGVFPKKRPTPKPKRLPGAPKKTKKTTQKDTTPSPASVVAEGVPVSPNQPTETATPPEANQPTEAATPPEANQPPEAATPAAKPKHKSFDNQISMYYRFRPGYVPHIKLFKNGNCHMTGLRTVEDGLFLLQVLHDHVAQVFQIDPEVIQDQNIQALKITRPIVRLINSDFHIPFKVRRKELHQLLIAPPYNTLCSFQPGTYPGVKLEYYWNAANPVQDGCCRCAQPCFQKKVGQCKKVTVAIFDSGSVLITGATSIAQVDDAYAFICGVIMGHVDYLKKNIPTPVPVVHPRLSKAAALKLAAQQAPEALPQATQQALPQATQQALPQALPQATPV